MCKAFEDWAKEEQEKGRKDGIRIGEQRGEKRGEKRGERRGEKRTAALISRLLRDGRIEDIRRATESAAVRKKLYLEYGI